MAFHAFTEPSAAALRTANLPWLPIIGAGGLGQVLMAALAYLMPVVIGGGPAIMRHGMATLEFAAPTRVMLRNAALALLAVSTLSGSEPLTAWWVIVLVCFAADAAALAASGVRQVRAGRAARIARENSPQVITARSASKAQGETPNSSDPTNGVNNDQHT